MESSPATDLRVGESPPCHQHHHQSQPVMSLLEKYSRIHEGIDQAREETTNLQGMIQQTQMEVERLRQERASMEAAIQSAESEGRVLTEKTEQALSDVETLQSKKTLVTSELELSKRKLDAAKKMAQDYRHEFLRETRAFRAECKTLVVRAGLLRLTPRAPLRAYAMVQASHPERGDERNPEMPEFAGRDDENDVEYDEILKGAIESLTAAQESLSKAEEDRECLTSKKKVVLEKAETRTNRKRQLYSQMTRIQTDVEELEASIAAIQEEITEAKEMGSNFERDVRRRKERQANAVQATRPATVNPYMKDSSSRIASIVPVANATSASTPTMATMGSQNHYNSADQQSHWSSRPVGTPNHSQHPHRVGRIRSSRQFGSSLQISVNSTLPVPRVNLRPAVRDETANIPASRRRPNPSGASKRVAHGLDRQQMNGDSDDSDDGDDVLGFKPFGK